MYNLMNNVVNEEDKKTFLVNLTISVELSPSNLLSMAALQEETPRLMLPKNKVFSLSSVQIEELIRNTVTDNIDAWMEMELENIADEAIGQEKLRKFGFTEENETTEPSTFSLIIID